MDGYPLPKQVLSQEEGFFEEINLLLIILWRRSKCLNCQPIGICNLLIDCLVFLSLFLKVHLNLLQCGPNPILRSLHLLLCSFSISFRHFSYRLHHLSLRMCSLGHLMCHFKVLCLSFSSTNLQFKGLDLLADFKSPCPRCLYRVGKQGNIMVELQK